MKIAVAIYENFNGNHAVQIIEANTIAEAIKQHSMMRPHIKTGYALWLDDQSDPLDSEIEALCGYAAELEWSIAFATVE